MKGSKSKFMNFFPVSYYSDEPIHSPLKVGLFTRIHEMKNTLSGLTPIAQGTISEKKVWLAENEEFLQRILDSVTQEDLIQFDEPDADPEMIKLLVEYTAVLQNLVTVSQSIFQAQRRSKKVSRHSK